MQPHVLIALQIPQDPLYCCPVFFGRTGTESGNTANSVGNIWSGLGRKIQQAANYCLHDTTVDYMNDWSSQLDQLTGVIWIGQPLFTEKILRKFHMYDCKPVNSDVKLVSVCS